MFNLKNIFIFCAVSFFCCVAKAQFVEQFTDGGYNVNPNWDGTENLFQVNAERQLVLIGDNSNSGFGYLSTELGIIDNVSYEFYIKLDYTLSENDYAEVFLASTLADFLDVTKSGYYLKIGKRGSGGALDFYLQEGSQHTLLKNVMLMGLNGYEAFLKVEKIGECKWVFYSKNSIADDYTLIDSVFNSQLKVSNYFGVSGTFTDDSKGKFFFDDFDIKSIAAPTPIPHSILTIKRFDVSENEFILTVNEDIDNAINNYADRFLIDGIPASSVNYINENQISIQPAQILETYKTYQLVLQGRELCVEDNLLDDTISFIITDIPKKDEIIVNEVMFNTDKIQYVEFYNTTDKFFKLRDIVFIIQDAYTQMNLEEISFDTSSYFIQAKDYFVFSTSAQQLKHHFPLADVTKCIDVDMQFLNSTEGIVGIKNVKEELVDKFKYSETFQSALLKTTKNVSLERLNTEMKTQDRYNWYSASVIQNYATPTQKNSVDKHTTIDNFKIEPEVFSPDQDGVDDLLTIFYDFDEPGTVTSMYVYSTEGRLVKTILKNEYLSTNGFVIWDGTDNNQNKASLGIYMLLMETIDPNGNKKISKGKCVLATRLN